MIGTRAGRRDDLRRCLALYESGQLRSIVRAAYPLEQVNEALQQLRAGVIGRIALTFD